MRLISVLVCLTVSSLWAQNEVRLSYTQVTPNLFMIEGVGGNMLLSRGKDGLFLVDDQVASVSEKVAETVKAIEPGPIKFIINTHWHHDHTGGNAVFRNGGTLTVAHRKVRERMQKENFTHALNRKTPPSPEAALPVITFTREMRWYFNDEEIHIYHVGNAHTDGDSIVWFKSSNVIHMGDVFFNGLYPLIDYSSGGTMRGMIKAVKRVLKDTDSETKIIPGHGPIATKWDLIQYLEMLEEVGQKVRSMKKAGKTLAEIKEAAPTKKWDEIWGKKWLKPDEFVAIVYNAL
ncbi:MBL fold metallo-hydrolase [Acanthopleuribacter pedis]|uniref:MBL fold metallo-hydrolase n=1 Tax=Acanthopleuribacter pedis TaxID=442870 RepID=A0A8J7U5Z4_9BACT|nr:MBL fold metallo-hydrolase [Acanthopleuribacter pedis]MBO1321359.1 MBL fold metallo-hydrolase [Acanthopleuribacter pedis]